MIFLITGAQLHNKGAESMLYIATSELLSRFPESTVYFCTTRPFDEVKYCFKKIIFYERSKRIALGGIDALFALAESIVKDCVKIIIGKTETNGHYFDVKRIMPSVDAIIDVSGFSIGDKWDYNTHISYINNIKLARAYGIPIFLMPQSFGPFNYKGKNTALVDRLREVLDYPTYIFSREKESTKELLNTFQLRNVVQSYDLVLQNDSFDINNVFTQKPEIKVPHLEAKKIVGIIPNIQCINHGDENALMRIYKFGIRELLQLGYTVVLFRHSVEDLPLCRNIKKMYEEDVRVLLLEDDLSCIEYEEFIKQFDYILCSRYHGLVHAYKNDIPCISIGWAIKYNELLELLGQEKYILNIDDASVEKISLLIEQMSSHHDIEKEIISQKMKRIRSANCFDILEQEFKSKVKKDL